MSFYGIEKKCKQCVKLDKNSKTCINNGYRQITNSMAIKCEYDQRKTCNGCGNYDYEESTCRVDGHFKDSETLRICKDWKEK